jgi:protein-tyrosine-phosphatase
VQNGVDVVFVSNHGGRAKNSLRSAIVCVPEVMAGVPIYIENFSFVIPGVLAGMAYPRSVDAMRELVDLGFRSVVALGDLPPEPVPLELSVHHEILPDFCRIPVSRLQAAVLAIRRAPPKVAVCCGGGVGRTGVVLACYLVSLGRTAYEAIAEVRTFRPGSIDDVALELSVHDYFESLGRQPPRPYAEPSSRPDPGAVRSGRSLSVPTSRRAPASPESALRSSETGLAAVFLMVRYRKNDAHREIERAICTTLEEYGLIPRRADWAHADNLLWGNVCRHMETSAFGIAVLEKLTEGEVSPNVCLELGYMLALGRPCLLLKERAVPEMQADLAGHLYKEFDARDIATTVSEAVRSWLEELGIAKRKGERLLIFVSEGGTCRDPMAKVILEQLLGSRRRELGIRIEAMAGRRPGGPGASRGARVAIQEMFNADLLAEHRTAVLTGTFIEEADLILVMEKTHLKGLPLEKSHTLRGFLGPEGDIADPWSPSSEPDLGAYRACAAEIRSILETGIERIVSKLGPATGDGNTPV